MGIAKDLKLMSEGWRWGRRELHPESVGPNGNNGRDRSTAWARSPAARAARALILEGGFGAILKLEVSASVRGLEVLEGIRPPVLFAANHSSHLDAPLVLTSLPASWRRKTAVGAAADYFFDVWWRAVGTALAFNTFPVERTGSRRSSGDAAELIEHGWNILVFPEGTRSQDGWMKDFRYGTARLSIAHQIPIVPVSIRGTYNAMPKGRGWPAPGRPPVSVTFGRPLLPFPDETDDSAEKLTNLLHEALARGLQEDATSWWDSLRSDASVKAPEGAPWRKTWEASRPLAKPTKAWK